MEEGFSQIRENGHEVGSSHQKEREGDEAVPRIRHKKDNRLTICLDAIPRDVR